MGNVAKLSSGSNLGEWRNEGNMFRANSTVTYGNKQNPDASDHVGDIRVKYEYYSAGSVYVLSQQVYDNKGQFTFRKWNPENLHAAYGESTD